MSPRAYFGLAIVLLLALVSPAGGEPTVLLLSMDGLHPADLAATELPALDRMAREGARAERMTPEFPTNTFPNHVSLVTGVSPERHGIVNNRFVDPERGPYSYDSDPTWLEAEPLWSIVDRHGIVSASFHWVGSEGPWRSGHGPRHWRPFDARTLESAKVDQIIAWLTLPAAERPRLVTAWFHGPDAAGHRHGPRSPEALAALENQDAQLARLQAALDAADAWSETTLIVVSDHGMHPVDRSVNLQGLLDDAGIAGTVHGGGGFVTVDLARPADDLARALVVAREAGLEAWPRGPGPDGLSTRNRRFGDLVALAPLGTVVRRDGLLERIRSVFTGGGHGYRPSERSMAAVFLALGRGVSRGGQPQGVRSRDVAPTVLALLGVPIPDSMEGRPIDLTEAGQPEGRTD
jgi:arylsulfatase A-like enzyme